ncbi:MAG: NADP-dependent oxidoreductase [Myxococcales bacterium]|nr:NADP-dependent oxidoreductase [Myxococcales bacterium]
MRAAVLHAYGPPENLVVEEVPEPVLDHPHHVRVAIHATSINPVDWKIRAGSQRGAIRYRLPRILGMDLAGEVLEVGTAVTRFRPGDEVYASPDWKGHGTYCEQAVIHEGQLALRPTSIDVLGAASLPLVGLTAWHCLHDALAERPGQRAFVMAGSGGVGSFAIQLCRHFGAHVATTCSGRNAELVRDLGADEVIDYTTTPFEEVLHDLDIVLDTLGHEATDRVLPLVRRGGLLASIVSGLPENTERFGPELGVLATGLHIAHLRLKGLRHGITARTVVRRPSGDDLAAIAGLVDAGAIRPVIDRVFPLEHIAEAHAYGETGRIRGKVVIDCRQGSSGGSP